MFTIQYSLKHKACANSLWRGEYCNEPHVYNTCNFFTAGSNKIITFVTLKAIAHSLS